MLQALPAARMRATQSAVLSLWEGGSRDACCQAGQLLTTMLLRACACDTGCVAVCCCVCVQGPPRVHPHPWCSAGDSVSC
jgi:hypothetical protein